MRSESKSAYERPEIRTVSAAELIEMIGPVQGYAFGSGGGASGVAVTPVDGLDGGLSIQKKR